MLLLFAPYLLQDFTTREATPEYSISVKDASPKYSVTIVVAGKAGVGGFPDLIQGPGTVTLKSRATGKVFQEIPLKAIAVLKNRIVTSVGKVGRAPAMDGNDPSLVFEDFNFDGYQDLAICSGLHNGHGGQSYDVYLFDSKQSRFVKNGMLSKLASEHLGLFDVDKRAHALLVYDKSGSAWHKETSYRFAHNRLAKIKVVIDDATGPKGKFTTKRLVGKTWKETQKLVPLPRAGE